tara:strand:+ start:907 stop:2505 length:1599 start_codon:yes stop_codon:yes gene_type:complete
MKKWIESLLPWSKKYNPTHKKESKRQTNNGKGKKKNTDIGWVTPSSIETTLPPTPQFNKDMLPEPLSEYVFHNAAQLDNAAPEFAAVAVVVCAAALIGGSAQICPKDENKGWKVKPILWGMIIANPSMMKTPSARVGLGPFERSKHDVIDKLNNQRQAEYNNEANFVEAKVARLNEKAKKLLASGSEEAAKELFNEANELALAPPALRNPLINDCTVEALVMRLESNPYGVLMFRDELYGWLSQLEKKERAHERALYLEAYNGNGSYTQERVSRDNVVLKNPTVSVLGNIQPSMLNSFLLERSSGSSNDGLFERFQLAVYSDSHNSRYTDIPDNEVNDNRVIELFSCLSMMGENEETVTLNFDADAQGLWTEWASEHKKRELKASADDQAVLGKYAALVAKLSLVFHLVEEAAICDDFESFHPELVVQKQSLGLAIRWSNFLYLHSVRIRAIGQNSQGSETAKLILERFGQLKSPFALRDVQRKGWKGLKTIDDCNAAITVLTNKGYIAPLNVEGKNGRVTNRYEIHPDYVG